MFTFLALISLKGPSNNWFRFDRDSVISLSYWQNIWKLAIKKTNLNFIYRLTNQFYSHILFSVHNTLEDNVRKTTSGRLLFLLKNRKIWFHSATSRNTVESPPQTSWRYLYLPLKQSHDFSNILPCCLLSSVLVDNSSRSNELWTKCDLNSLNSSSTLTVWTAWYVCSIRSRRFLNVSLNYHGATLANMEGITGKYRLFVGFLEP